MSIATKTQSAAIRERLKHPIVDGDGHLIEVMPVFYDYIREIGGEKVLEKWRASEGDDWQAVNAAERRDRRITRRPFWGLPTGNTLDRATVTFPNLLRSRMDDLGIDFMILYSTLTLAAMRHPDEEVRLAASRAFNTMAAEHYGPHADRFRVVALIPMNNPDEAIAELDYAVGKLGLKSVVLGSCIRRPIPFVERKDSELAKYATFMDVIGLSSDFNYDPVWQKCVDLKVPVTVHTSVSGWGSRTTPDNYIYNHIGQFAQGGEAFCKAVVLGGVAQRFPTLKFAFLEGGVGWACNLYNDLIEHWNKRNINAMRENLDPARLDMALMAELFAKFGGSFAARMGDTSNAFANAQALGDPGPLDEFAALKIDDPREFALMFENFFFGCEADDRMNAVAFNPKLNHYGAKMQAMFSSDVGHFDVPDITATVSEAYELVEDGLITEEDFKDFTFGNAVKLHASMNPDFFKGTSVEDAAARHMRP